jgi:hypothetical protein
MKARSARGGRSVLPLNKHNTNTILEGSWPPRLQGQLDLALRFDVRDHALELPLAHVVLADLRARRELLSRAGIVACWMRRHEPL